MLDHLRRQAEDPPEPGSNTNTWVNIILFFLFLIIILAFKSCGG